MQPHDLWRMFVYLGKWIEIGLLQVSIFFIVWAGACAIFYAKSPQQVLGAAAVTSALWYYRTSTMHGNGKFVKNKLEPHMPEDAQWEGGEKGKDAKRTFHLIASQIIILLVLLAYVGRAWWGLWTWEGHILALLFLAGAVGTVYSSLFK